jgi:hypothetical protein
MSLALDWAHDDVSRFEGNDLISVRTASKAEIMSGRELRMLIMYAIN